MNTSGRAPTLVSWVIALVPVIVALAARFSLIDIGKPVATWSRIVGLAPLLAACRVRGL